jgi:ABC-type glycerol-3-phosphate transport system substrate-binding protein
MKTRFLRPGILAIMIASAMLTGCVASTGTPAAPTTVSQESVPTATPLPEPVTITFWECWGGVTGDFLVEEADRFHEQYPWITVEVSHFSGREAFREAFALAFESENAPDTFTRGHSFMQMIENEWIQPLDPWITPEWKARFPEGAFSETRNMWRGETYSFTPFAAPGVSRVLFINEDLFREAGLVDADGDIQTPETWGDLRSMAAQITEAGKGEFYGIGIGIKDPRPMVWWFDLATLAGAPMTPYDYDLRTGKFVYSTHPAFAQIIELLLGMKEDGSVYPHEGTIDDSNIYSFFGQAKFAMFMSGSYHANNLSRDFPDFQNYRIIPVPVPDEGQTGEIPSTPGQGHFFISAQSQHPDEAWLWIDWLASRGLHERMVANGIAFSIFADLNKPESIPDVHQAQAYAAQAGHGVFGPFPPARNPDTALVLPEPVMPDVGDMLVGIYTGQIEDWQQALVDLDAHKQAALEAAIQEAREDGVDVSLEDFIFPDWNPMENYVTKPAE